MNVRFWPRLCENVDCRCFFKRMLKHETGHMNGSNTGTLTFYFRPNREVRKNLHDASGNITAIQMILDKLSIDDYESVFTGRSEADFLEDAVYEEIVGDFKKLTFPSALRL